MRVRSRIFLFPLVALLGCDSGSTPSTTPTPAPPVAAATPTPAPPAPNRAPTATISDWQPRTTAVVGGTRVGFGAKGSDPDGDKLTFKWDFDDGTEDAGEALFHVFQEAGTFTVTLTVTDGRGGSASDEVVVRARDIDGLWTVVNAKHIPLEATIKRWPNSTFIAGTTTDRSSFEGHLLDPYGIRIEYETGDERCIPSGTYEGTIDPNLKYVEFPGNGCRNIKLLR